MRLYHGSNVEIQKIDFNKSNPYKDFGKGFYLTENRDHALSLATRRSSKIGGKASVSEFEFDKENAFRELKVKVFEKPSNEWAEFVKRNRDHSLKQPAHDYDIVIGPIANDDVVASFRLYELAYISIEALVERLKYKELSIQYFFHNERAVKFLKKITDGE